MVQLNPKVKQVAEAIESFSPDDQRQLISILPSLLKIPPEDYSWLKLAESAFTFWDNEEDAVYDHL